MKCVNCACAKVLEIYGYTDTVDYLWCHYDNDWHFHHYLESNIPEDLPESEMYKAPRLDDALYYIRDKFHTNVIITASNFTPGKYNVILEYMDKKQPPVRSYLGDEYDNPEDAMEAALIEIIQVITHDKNHKPFTL